MLDQLAVADPDHVQATGLKRGAETARRDLDIAELLALVNGVARAGSPAQAERFLGVLLEGITPR